MNVARSWNRTGLVLVAACIAAASVFALVGSYRAEVDAHRRVLIDRGQTVLDALRAGIFAHGRMGRYRADRLDVVFEELARHPGVVALALQAPDGSLMSQGGDVAELPPRLPQAPSWTGNRLVMTLPLNLAEDFGPRGERHGWQGREDLEQWVPFPSGTYWLATALDASEFYRNRQRDRFELAIAVAVLAAALTVGAWSVDLMLKRAALAADLDRERARAQRQQQAAQLGAGLAHETKNPLGIVRGLAQSIAGCADPRCAHRDAAKSIVDEVDRVIGGINSFLAISRPREATPVPVSLDVFFEEFLPLVQLDASAAEVAIEYVPCQTWIEADADLLRRAVLNLVLNAVKASSPGGEVRVDTLRTGSTLAVRIHDHGCGIPAEDIDRVKEPYVTRFEGGSGLGLSVVEQIAAAHGWRLTLRSALGEGTVASLEGITMVEPA